MGPARPRLERDRVAAAAVVRARHPARRPRAPARPCSTPAAAAAPSCALAADHGAVVSGIDASEALLAIARERVPDADLLLGDLQRLPYADDTFDAVTGFSSFFFADDMVEALREAGRVAKPGAPIVIQVWGRPERFDLGLMKAVLARFRPPPPAAGVDPSTLWQPGVLEDARRPRPASSPTRAFDVRWAYEYADERARCRAMMSAGGFGAIARPDRQDAARAAIARGARGLPHARRAATGSRTSGTYLIARRLGLATRTRRRRACGPSRRRPRRARGGLRRQLLVVEQVLPAARRRRRPRAPRARGGGGR